MYSQHDRRRSFELEAYWGNPDGVLLHGTIEVRARSMEEALEVARSVRLIPSDPTEHYDSVARDEYFEGHYDVEPLGEGYEELIRLENWKAVIKAISGRR